jgi:KipI family sensor histidine kinase inhibitor
MRRFVRFGESSILVDPEPFEDPHELVRAIRDLDGVDEVLAGAAVLVNVEAGRTDSVAAKLGSIPPRAPSVHRGRLLEIPVAFDGPDLAEVARSAGMSERGIVDAIAGASLRVAYLGFAPGFAYVQGLPDALSGIGRRPSPRTSVPAGSVGIAGGYLGVYPQKSPGGWNLLGRTDIVLFDPHVAPHATLQPGDRLRLVPTESVGPSPPLRQAEERPRCSTLRRFVVEEPGLLTTLQDGGRVNVGHLGVPGAGAADLESMRLANLIAGNPQLSGALETTLVGPLLRFDAAAHAVVVGADVAVDGRSVASGAVVEVPAGARLKVGKSSGLRGYVAVSGGIRGTELFGSCSSDLLSGLGPGPLQAGDELAIGHSGNHPRGYAHRLSRGSAVRILRGPHPVDRDSLEAWAGKPFQISPDSNRIGVRLTGPQRVDLVEPSRGSHGMVHGAVQIPPSGEPIVLLCDHATMGGYPVIATVISADLGALAQRRPGDSVHFEIVGLEEALEARVALDRRLARAPSGLYPSGEVS